MWKRSLYGLDHPELYYGVHTPALPTHTLKNLSKLDNCGSASNSPDVHRAKSVNVFFDGTRAATVTTSATEWEWRAREKNVNPYMAHENGAEN